MLAFAYTSFLMSYIAAFVDVDLLAWSQQYLERLGSLASPTFLPSAGYGNVVSNCVHIRLFRW